MNIFRGKTLNKQCVEWIIEFEDYLEVRIRKLNKNNNVWLQITGLVENLDISYAF